MSLIKSLRVCGNDRMLRTQIKYLVGLHKDKGVMAHHYKVSWREGRERSKAYNEF